MVMIICVDWMVGKVFDFFKEFEIEDDMIIFYIIDNGVNVVFNCFLNSYGGLWGNKCDFYEGGIWVLMVVCWLGKVFVGVVSDGYWGMVDMFFIVCELVGIEFFVLFDGRLVVFMLIGDLMF